MRISSPIRIGLLRRALSGLAALAIVLLLPAAVLGAGEPAPHFSTGGVSHATSTSGNLEGTVNTEGFATSYVFEYGPTVLYGAKTKPVAVPIPSPLKTVKVGQQVTGLLTGYHYRIVGFYTTHSGKELSLHGSDKTFSGGKSSKLRFKLLKGKEEQVSAVYGGSATLIGTLTGLNNGGRLLGLQATPFPFTSPFATLAGTVVSGRTGGFTFNVARLTQTTEFRFVALNPRPLDSPTLVVHVTPRITLHVRGGGTGLYRLYGTVSPARTGAAVLLQELIPQKAGSKRSGPRPRAVATTVLKRLNSKSSRFSVITRLAGTAHYRVFVRLPKGALESGHSADVLIRSSKKATGKRHHK